MCHKCMKEMCPDRGSTCLEKGSYLLNYKCCVVCEKRSLLQEVDVQKEGDDTDETITFNHRCKECGHVVASHTYTFCVDEDFQEYGMDCNLCGHGEATVSILPD